MTIDAYRQLMDWLTEDREVRSFEIHVTANDPEWPEAVEDPRDDDAIWSWTYSITAHDVHIYGDEGINGMVGLTYHGEGTDLDEAARGVLLAIAEMAPPPELTEHRCRPYELASSSERDEADRLTASDLLAKADAGTTVEVEG